MYLYIIRVGQCGALNSKFALLCLNIKRRITALVLHTIYSGKKLPHYGGFIVWCTASYGEIDIPNT